MRKIMFTGGGSAGHVTVNLALAPRFHEEDWELVYVGSVTGIEKELVRDQNIKYISIPTGKLRRYFDWRNFTDPWKVVTGTFRAYRAIRREKPNVLFSKGGFVSVPVVIGAWLNRIPIVIHESDLTPGLANRIATKFANTICTTFQESEKHLPTAKVHYVGPVIRDELKAGNAEKGKQFCAFEKQGPILLVMGGSLGAKNINRVVRSCLDELTQDFNIVHLCGKNQVDATITRRDYRQYEFLQRELPDVLAAADVVVSRAGSNSIFELLHLEKPMLLIPLTKAQSRGDQLLNARAFESLGYCKVLFEEEMSDDSLIHGVRDVYTNRLDFIGNMKRHERTDPLAKVFELITEVARS